MAVLGGSGTKQQQKQTRADQNFALTTTATTADQEIGATALTDNKKYTFQAIFIEVSYTTVSTTEAHFGELTVRWGTTAILGPIQASNPTSAAPFGFIVMLPSGGLVIEGDGSTEINAICTPAAVTSTKWKVSLLGYVEDI